MDRLDGPAAPRVDVAAVVHVRAAHVCAGRPDLHFGPTADYELVFDGDLHRLGRRADGTRVRIDLSPRIGQHWRGRDWLPHTTSCPQSLARWRHVYRVAS